VATFVVEVRQEFIQIGSIEIEATCPRAAIERVQRMMNDQKNPLQTCDPRIQWRPAVYVDFSFDTTNEVDD